MKTDAEILTSMTQCLASYGSHLARSMNGDLVVREEVVLCNPRFASKSKNMVVPLRILSVAEANELAKLVANFYDAPDRWVLWSLSDQPHLPAAGFEQYSATNAAMTLGSGNLTEVVAVDGLEFEAVHDEQGVRLFEQVREESRGKTFPTNPEPGQFLEERVLAPYHRLWVGHLNGLPVATGALFEADGVSMVKNIAVRPDVRGQGIGKAMSAFVVRAANATPVLDADDEAPKLYRRLGFHEIGSVRYWKLR